MHILVYNHTKTKRSEYIINHILGTMLGLKVEITNSNNEFKSYNGPRLSYSKTASFYEDAICVKPCGLLCESDIFDWPIDVFQWRLLPAFFPTNSEGLIPFDIFAASFYLLSRYEECLPGNKDEHGRFCYNKSIAFRNGFLEIPLVDLWVFELGQMISEKFPQVKILRRAFKYTPTIDIDNAFAYKHKGFVRSALATLRSLLQFKFNNFAERVAVLLGRKPDPFDTYQELFRIFKNHPQAIWFILGGKYGKYDKHVSLNNIAMKSVVKGIDKHFNVGVHPSYGSHTNYNRLKDEVSQLRTTIGKEVTKSRHHFLRIELPATYRLLSDIGIREDYSMGYSKATGFRASTCTPYPFFDLLNNEVLPVKVIPFQVMDRALLQGLGLTPHQAVSRTLNMALKVKEVGGEFVTVWHNESLSGKNEWKGWGNVLATVVHELEKLSS